MKTIVPTKTAVLCGTSAARKAPMILRQPGYAFVRELELLLKVGSAAAGRSKGLGGIVVHNGILLLHL